mgnify:CR=1 FL=1
MSIFIGDDNSVTVRCPMFVGKKEIENFVQSKSGWITSHLARNASRKEKFAEVVGLKKIFVGGQAVDLVFCAQNKVTDDAVYIRDEQSVRKLFIRSFGEKFFALFDRLSSDCSLKAQSVGFRAYKGRWGCCDGKNNIRFNYKILMLPERLQEYIIVHELCHTIVHNHSARFKALLLKCLPDFRLREAELKECSFLARMY